MSSFATSPEMPSLDVKPCFAVVLLFVFILLFSFASNLAGQTPLAFRFDGAENDRLHGEFAEPAYAQLIYLLQGERRKLARDFVAQLDGDVLRIALEDRGLVRTTADQELTVSLIQASSPRIDLRPDPDGRVEFSRVKAGLAALVVTADTLSDVSLTSLYAAVPLFLVTDEAERAGEAAIAPLAEVSPDSVLRQLRSEVYTTSDRGDALDTREFEVVPFSRFRVQRMADGSVRGRVLVPQRDFLALPGVTHITFQQEGRIAASAYSDEEGNFVAENVPAGVHSLVAIGRSGHAAYSIEVLDFQGGLELRDPQSQVPAGRVPEDRGSERSARFVARQQPVGSSLIVVLIPPALMDQVLRLLNERFGGAAKDELLAQNGAPVVPLAEDSSPSNAAAGAGFSAAGGGGFGSGGGSAYGGGGGALGLAALATSIAALSTIDDDGFSASISTPLTQ